MFKCWFREGLNRKDRKDRREGDVDSGFRGGFTERRTRGGEFRESFARLEAGEMGRIGPTGRMGHIGARVAGQLDDEFRHSLARFCGRDVVRIPGESGRWRCGLQSDGYKIII